MMEYLEGVKKAKTLEIGEKRYIPRLERLRSQNRSHIITRMHLISSTDSKKPAIPLRAA